MIRRPSARTVALIAGSVITALLVGGGLFLIHSLREHDEERLSFELYRLSTDLLDGSAPVPPEVVGYALIGGRGEVLLLGGIGDPHQLIVRPNAHWRNTEGMVIYHRQLGRLGANPPVRSDQRPDLRTDSGGGRQIVLWYNPTYLEAEQRVRDLLLYGGLIMLAGLALLSSILTRRLFDAEQRLLGQERLALLGQAARTISHEIKNPLAALDLHRQLAVAKTPPPEIAAHLQVIAQESARIQRVIAEVARFVHPERAQPELIDLRQWLTEFVAVQPQLVLAPDLPDAPSGVLIDPLHLRSIVENLTRNAIDSHAQSGQAAQPVELTIRPERQTVQLLIRDYGSGLDPAVKARVFDPFFTTKSDGTGLGVALAQRLAHLAGGALDYPPHSGQGCVARLTLPLHNSAGGKA